MSDNCVKKCLRYIFAISAITFTVFTILTVLSILDSQNIIDSLGKGTRCEEVCAAYPYELIVGRCYKTKSTTSPFINK